MCISKCLYNLYLLTSNFCLHPVYGREMCMWNTAVENVDAADMAHEILLMVLEVMVVVGYWILLCVVLKCDVAGEICSICSLLVLKRWICVVAVMVLWRLDMAESWWWSKTGCRSWMVLVELVIAVTFAVV